MLLQHKGIAGFGKIFHLYGNCINIIVFSLISKINNIIIVPLYWADVKQAMVWVQWKMIVAPSFVYGRTTEIFISAIACILQMCIPFFP